MKKSVLASTCLLLIALVGCNKTEDSVSPANNQHALGMVVQTAASGSSSNLILLRDGRTINPISGFAPTNLRAGNKFNLSFTVVPNSTSSKILDANVTNFTAANDSTFIPVSVGQDSATVKNFLNGTFTGTFTLAKCQLL